MLSIAAQISRKAFRQRGIGMVEVLIAILILSIGVLGYAGLQLRALNSTEDSYYRTQATAIARDVAERIGANAVIDTMDIYANAGSWGGADNFTRDIPAGWNQCVGRDVCTREEMANNDILQARWQAWNLLPSGRVQVSDCDGSGMATPTTCIVVTWGDMDPATCGQQAASECVVLEQFYERLVAAEPPAP